MIFHLVSFFIFSTLCIIRRHHTNYSIALSCFFVSLCFFPFIFLVRFNANNAITIQKIAHDLYFTRIRVECLLVVLFTRDLYIHNPSMLQCYMLTTYFCIRNPFEAALDYLEIERSKHFDEYNWYPIIDFIDWPLLQAIEFSSFFFLFFYFFITILRMKNFFKRIRINNWATL